MTTAAPWQPRSLAGDPALSWHDLESGPTPRVPGACDADHRVVLLHGVTRCGRDFEPLVAALITTDEQDAAEGLGLRLAVLDRAAMVTPPAHRAISSPTTQPMRPASFRRTGPA